MNDRKKERMLKMIKKWIMDALQIQDVTVCYKDIYSKKKIQTIQSKIDIFLKRGKPNIEPQEIVPYCP